LTNNGHVCPDLITGQWDLKVMGNFTQTETGNLNVDIASASNYGRVQVDGDGKLSGVLFVSLPTSYSPTVGQTFPNIISASGGLTANFSQIIAYPPNVTWQANQNGSSLSLQVVSVSN
jgi:fibronectin-binding autotransporter adhesin